jgi:hypothetical protein
VKEIVFILLMLSCLGFNWEECKQGIRDRGVPFGHGQELMTSTSQFLSSNGECNMLGKRDHDSKLFIAHNLDKMKEDFARGQGEFARAYASMRGCDTEAQNIFPPLIKSNYLELEMRNNVVDVHDFLLRKMSDNIYLRRNCIFLSEEF